MRKVDSMEAELPNGQRVNVNQLPLEQLGSIKKQLQEVRDIGRSTCMGIQTNAAEEEERQKEEDR